MDIDKAIKLLKESHNHNYAWRGSKLDEAIKLGIEGLKRIQTAREVDPMELRVLLPGETEE